MLNITLQFLKEELNTYLHVRTGTSTDVVKVCGIVDETGKYEFDKDLIAASIINIEEERILKSHLNQYELVNNLHVVPDTKSKVDDINKWHALKPDGPPVTIAPDCSKVTGTTVLAATTQLPGPTSATLIN
jgi:hypothetical protein